ncbi:hypothetical protein HYFRA_00006357 [Hymenoscyphus fraxineus]|uniref:NACHT domain-containing protein n=1 Tax=Hymenoscyphus fraxineus TaxID=746836 RepID=A0A9N9PPE5_9HELO|nr:hypothetical protein HYFRA_00006357 [Hymenoscyphus fraxineus]
MGRMRFYSFVEGEVTVPLGRRVVDDISSQMNVPNEVVIHMPGEDHRSIARFSSVTSPSYKKVLAKLREAVYAALSPVMKIIEEEDGRNILSLKGHPGTGKSTLLSTLHRHLTQTTPSAIHLSFFFTSRGVLLQRSVLGMYRALLWQVYRQSSRAREMVLEVYEEKVQSFGKEGWEWGVSELRGLVGRVVRRVSREREVIVLVDAVDEAVRGDGERAAGEVVEWFYTLDNTDLGSGSGDGDGDGDGSDVNGLRICISSRHYPIISLESRLEIRLEDENANDLHRYIHDSLRLGIQGWANEPEHITQPLLSIISSKAAGVFQWAVLRVPKIIKSLNDGEVTFEESQKMIEQESNELFPLYQKIITNDVSLSLRSRSLLFLQWVAFAERPLSLAELRFAIASDGQDRPFSQDCCEKEGGFIDSDARMAKLTKSLSGGLAEVVVCESVSRVQFIHQTVNEYLRSQGLEMLSSFSMDVGRGDVIGRSQQRLTTSCLNYLRIEYVVDAINAWIKWNEKIPVFIEYTAKYLFQHASHAEQHGNIQKDLATFFNTHPDLFPLWQKICWKLDTSRPYCATEHLIHIAAVFNISSIVQYFLERGVTLEVRDRDGHTPLALVAKRGDERMTRMFLDLGADVNTVNDDNCTPLELAAANSHETVVKQLLEKGAEIQGKGEMRTFRSALQGAVFGGRLSLVRVLIASGADINTRHEYYGTPLQEAAALETDDIAMLLIESGAEINTPCGRDGSALQAAAYRGHRSLIRVLLERGADVNAQGGEYGNALQAAAIYGIGHIDIIKLLLASGADINAVGGAYGTVLQAVLLPGNEALIQLLLDHGADVNIQAGEFGNAIMSAAMSGDEGIVRMLIEKGADIHAVAGEYGNTLQAAVLSGNGALVEFLLEIGVDVNVRCGKYGTALQAAVICKPELAETLLKWKADVNIPGTEYGNPLYAAVSLGRNDLISRILERGANVNMKVERHLSTLFSKVLQQAAKKGDTKVVKQLLAYGAEVNAVDETYGTALKIASTSGFKEVAEMLLDSGADVNLTGPLRAAAVGGHREVVELLINRGADSDPNDDISTIISKARGGQRKAPDHY